MKLPPKIVISALTREACRNVEHGLLPKPEEEEVGEVYYTLRYFAVLLREQYNAELIFRWEWIKIGQQ